MLALVLVLCLQEKPKVEFKSALEKSGDEWTFKTSGTAPVPDGTILRGRAYVLDDVIDPQSGNTVVDEEAMFYGDEAFDSFEVEKGEVKGNLYRLRRRPYSLRYRVKLIYDPEYQNNVVRAKLGREKFEWTFDLRYGTDERLAAELKECADELRGEFERIKALYEELKKEFASQQAKKDLKGWESWKKEWVKKVNEIGDRNATRFMIWTVWIERQGKLRIEGFTGRLPELAGDCTDHLKGEKDALARANHHLQTFLDYFEEAIEVVGLEMPLDIAAIGPALAQYEKAMKALREFAAKPDAAAWEKIRAGVKRDGSEALLAIAGTLGTRKKAYGRLDALRARFTQLMKLGDAGSKAEEFKEPLATQDQALKDFKDFAGLK